MMKLRYVYFLFLFFLIPTILFGQNIGMQYYAHEKELDKRTGLSLNEDENIKINTNFTLNFDIAFTRNQLTYFGYILRIIANDSLNIDLVYDDVDFTINMIDGKSAKIVSAPMPLSKLAQFKNVSINFNRDKSSISLLIADSVYTIHTSAYNNATKWKFLFGINHTKHFKTTDLPSMQMRQISLFENGKKVHEWRLNKKSGNRIADEIGKADAYVENPFWLYNLHNNWKFEKELTFNNYTQFVQKRNSDTLFFLSSDSLSTYSFPDEKIINRQALKRKINLSNGSQVAYNYLSDEIIYYSIDQKIFSTINITSLEPKNMIPEKKGLTEFWQHNKFFYPADTSLITIGGYGHLVYKNTINTINLNNGEWNSTSPDKNILCPRYLAALGTANDTLYLLGGYGSISGKQKINPGYVYDLVRIIPGTKEVEKVYSVNDPGIEEFCLSNSMIIDTETSEFYALAYSKYEYKNNLKLIRGSLKTPRITVDNKTISFNFHDIMSYVNLLYSPTQRKLYAITLFYNDKGITSIKIYSISYPPEISNKTAKDKKPTHSGIPFALGSGLIILGIILAVILFIRRQKQGKPENTTDAKSGLKPAHKNRVTTNNKKPDTAIPEPECNYSIMLFGGFNVVDNKNNTITNQFTPLLKELFLLIYLNSKGKDRIGISSSKLKEILWYDKSDKDAGNNQAVNIARLKVLLKKIGNNITISKSTGYWEIVYGENKILSDYDEFIRITQLKQPNKQDIIKLIQITKKGGLLQNLNYDWLDSFKADVSNQIIDLFNNFNESEIAASDRELLIKIADTMFLFDPVNEDALSIKCIVLSKMGKHSLAKNTYNHFIKEYKVLYNEDYALSFNQIIDA